MADGKSDSTSHSSDNGEWCECNKSCLKRLCRMTLYWRGLILFTVVMIYLFLGGLIFSALERPNEMRQNEAELEANETYFQTLEVIVDLLVNNSNFSREEAMYLVNNISDAAIRASDVTPSENWIYASSIFFTVTVVTTIGKLLIIHSLYDTHLSIRVWNHCSRHKKRTRLLYNLCNGRHSVNVNISGSSGSDSQESDGMGSETIRE